MTISSSTSQLSLGIEKLNMLNFRGTSGATVVNETYLFSDVSPWKAYEEWNKEERKKEREREREKSSYAPGRPWDGKKSNTSIIAQFKNNIKMTKQ